MINLSVCKCRTLVVFFQVKESTAAGAAAISDGRVFSRVNSRLCHTLITHPQKCVDVCRQFCPFGRRFVSEIFFCFGFFVSFQRATLPSTKLTGRKKFVQKQFAAAGPSTDETVKMLTFYFIGSNWPSPTGGTWTDHQVPPVGLAIQKVFSSQTHIKSHRGDLNGPLSPTGGTWVFFFFKEKQKQDARPLARERKGGVKYFGFGE